MVSTLKAQLYRRPKALVYLFREQVCKLLKPSPDRVQQTGGLQGCQSRLLLQAGTLEGYNGRILVLSESGVEGHLAGYAAVLQANPGVYDVVTTKLGLVDCDLTTSTSPVRVAAIARVTVEAQIQAISVLW